MIVKAMPRKTGSNNINVFGSFQTLISFPRYMGIFSLSSFIFLRGLETQTRTLLFILKIFRGNLRLPLATGKRSCYAVQQFLIEPEKDRLYQRIFGCGFSICFRGEL